MMGPSALCCWGGSGAAFPEGWKVRGRYRPRKITLKWPSKVAHHQGRAAAVVGGWVRWWRMFQGRIGKLASPFNGGGAVIGREQRVLLRHYLEQGMSKAAIARHLRISRRTVYA